MSDQITINSRPIGPGHPPYIIAEMSANHLGQLDRALKFIEMAQEKGADAVKIQTYTADTITLDHDGPDFSITDGPWAGRTLYDLYQEAHTPWDWHEALFDHAKKVGITLFSSPFDDTAVDLLEGLNAPAYKIASFELVDLPLIRKVAGIGKPLIMSRGMATRGEIEEALATAREAGAKEILLLHCVSGYPTPADQANLRTITDLARSFDVAVGLSDHTLGVAVSTAAVALGAVAIEKHVTFDRAEGGADSEFSLEPEELAQLVEQTRTAWSALGKVHYETKTVEESSKAFRRSLYVVADVKAGDLLTPENVRSIRPGYGLAPRHYDDVIGRPARHDITRGTALQWSLID